MLFTQYANVDSKSTFDNSNDIDMYALEEALNESEFNMKVFDYEYNHEFHNAEMIAIEAYKESNGNTAVLESQFEVIKEGFLGKIWDKFKSFLKMIWDAIVKAITKLLEWLRIKKKKLEEEQEKAEEEVKESEKQSSTTSASNVDSNDSTPKNTNEAEKPKDSSQTSEEVPKAIEPPKNMSQAVQQQEAKKKKEGYFADKKKPVERKDNRQWGKKTPSRRFARKIPVNKIVIQNGYIDINNASDILVKWEENIIKFFKYTASIISELLSGKIPSGYDSLFKRDYDTHSDNSRDKYGYYNATKEGEKNYIELMWNKSGATDLYYRVTVDDKRTPENWAIAKLSNQKFSDSATIKIGRTVEKERQLRNNFITISSKRINKNTISDIKKSLDDVDKKLNNISDKSDLANQNVKINRLAYNGFRLAYLNQLMLVRGITKLIELSERGEREAIAAHDKGEKAA